MSKYYGAEAGKERVPVFTKSHPRNFGLADGYKLRNSPAGYALFPTSDEYEALEAQLHQHRDLETDIADVLDRLGAYAMQHARYFLRQTLIVRPDLQLSLLSLTDPAGGLIPETVFSAEEIEAAYAESQEQLEREMGEAV